MEPVSPSPNQPFELTDAELEANATLIEEPPPPPWCVEPDDFEHVDDVVEPLVQTQAPKKDWCGSLGTEWVPDGAFGVDWSDACKTHDECYATPGADKFLCDYNLSQDISLACGAQDGGLLCFVAAELYYHGVRTPQGQEAFERAQAAADVKK